jgi:hypothetical protein
MITLPWAKKFREIVINSTNELEALKEFHKYCIKCEKELTFKMELRNELER